MQNQAKCACRTVLLSIFIGSESLSLLIVGKFGVLQIQLSVFSNKNDAVKHDVVVFHCRHGMMYVQ